MDWLETIKVDLRKARVINVPRGDGGFYQYIVNPLSSGVPAIPTEALWGCAFEVARCADLRGAQKILVPEAMGIHIGAALSLVTGLPLLVIRKKPNHLADEREVVKRTAYAETRMYVAGLQAGDHVILVDSIIATGGTYAALITALHQMGVEVQDAVAVIERTEFDGVARVERETGVRVKTLVKAVLHNDRVEVL